MEKGRRNFVIKMEYKTINQIKIEKEHKAKVDKIRYNLQFNKKKFLIGFLLFSVGFWNPTPFGSIGAVMMFSALPVACINWDKHLIKLRRLRLKFR